MHQVTSGPLAAIESRGGDYVLNVTEAAKILSISPRTLRRIITAGKISAVQVSARRRGILASELARYMGAGTSEDS